jgi:UDP:flavonoid glycosyltransferase YjiC (YdhE family)
MLEAVFAGVPLLDFPIVWDQLVNGRLVADEWKIGTNLREQKKEDGTISRSVISAVVTKLMDLGNGDSQEMRRRAAELHDASRSAIEGESSQRSELFSETSHRRETKCFRNFSVVFAALHLVQE